MKQGEISEDQLIPVRKVIERAEECLSQLPNPDRYAKQCLEVLKTLSAKGLYPCTSSLFYLNTILEGNSASDVKDDIPNDWSEDIKDALATCGMTYAAYNYEKVRELSTLNDSMDTGAKVAAIKSADTTMLDLWIDESPSIVAAIKWPELNDEQQFRLIVLDSFVLDVIAGNWADQLKDWHRFFILYVEPWLIRED